MHNWKIGDLAVCIDDNWKMRGKHPLIKTWPVKGCVYTIRGFTNWYSPQHKEKRLGLLLEEIITPEMEWTNPETNEDLISEPSFSADKFRPVKKTDISKFTSMLGPSPTKTKKKILEDA